MAAKQVRKPKRAARSASIAQPSKHALELAKAKLLSSGLTLADAQGAAIDVLDGPVTARLAPIFKNLCALRFNYLGPNGLPIEDVPAGGPYYRLRYLEQEPGFAQATKHGGTRYVQQRGTAPVAYFPSNQAGWPDLCTDTTKPLILTEGELKALAACKAGFPTIGLGGVWSWRSHAQGITWLPSLDLVHWPRRHTYVAFDSDYLENPLVCDALQAFADALYRRGAVVHLVTLPKLDGIPKTGLDDFLVHQGASGPARLRGLLHEAEPLGLAKPLWELNKQYAYVREPGGLVVAQEAGTKRTSAVFKELEGAVEYQARVLKKDGSLSFDPVSASEAWMKWPLRRDVNRLVYSPGKDRLYEDRDHGPVFNLWSGWGCEPKRGDVEPFRRLLDHLFSGTEPEAKRWFLRWLAYPLQYPGTKLFSAAMIHGMHHGTGKSFLGYSMRRIYGKSFSEITQAELTSAFNTWLAEKQFVMADDITGSDRREHADLLKKMITQLTVRINEKYLPAFEIKDCVNYLFTANQPDALFLEDRDRRFFVHEVTVPPLTEGFYREYELWLDSGGAEALFYYLLHDVKTDGFNPAGAAYRTAAKERLIQRVLSDLGEWVRELLATPDQVLRVGGVALKRDLLTSKELLTLYDPGRETKVTANGLARELARAGLRQVCEGRPVRSADGSQQRYFAVRHGDQWAKATSAAVAQHLVEVR